ncbi:BrnT family toxin [bacterium]|nr:BrnT family toxin [bacterium]
MTYYKWNHDKNEKLKAERGLSFEQVILHIERGDLIDVIEHPNQSKYPNQQMLIVKIKDYAYLVPFVEDEEGKYLKTIIPSRKATREYLGGRNGENKTR